MKPDRTQPDKPLSLKSLEAQLRQLPRPPVPGRLQDRLIAAIPTAQVTGQKRQQGLHAWRYLVTAASVAAGLAIAVFVTHFYTNRTDTPVRPSGPAIVDMDVARVIEREATSARLAATARILAQQPGMQAEAERTYEYIAQAYGDTAIARQIPSSSQQTQGEI